jgi:hypothetical protein
LKEKVLAAKEYIKIILCYNNQRKISIENILRAYFPLRKLCWRVLEIALLDNKIEESIGPNFPNRMKKSLAINKKLGMVSEAFFLISDSYEKSNHQF